jgi:ribonuclease D
VLLAAKSEEHDVAPRLLASSDDLDRLATEAEPSIPATQGWRRRMFGEDAMALRDGRVALATRGKRIRLIYLDAEAPASEAEA